MKMGINEATQLLSETYKNQLLKTKNQTVINFLNQKIRHTYGVMNATSRIISREKSLRDLPQETKDKAIVCAILHDIARLYQFSEDGNSLLNTKVFEHGNEGYNILKNYGIEDTTILLAIKHHNKFKLDGLQEEKEYLESTNESKEEILTISRILRDADKLENLESYTFTQFEDLFSFATNDTECNTEFRLSEECLSDFFNRTIVRHCNIKTTLDNIFKLKSWIFDIEFESTKNYIKTLGMMEVCEAIYEKHGVKKETINKIKETYESIIR